MGPGGMEIALAGAPNNLVLSNWKENLIDKGCKQIIVSCVGNKCCCPSYSLASEAARTGRRQAQPEKPGDSVSGQLSVVRGGHTEIKQKILLCNVMCRMIIEELECKEEKEQQAYDQSVQLLTALIFLIHAERHEYRYFYDEETGEVDFLDLTE